MGPVPPPPTAHSMEAHSTHALLPRPAPGDRPIVFHFACARVDVMHPICRLGVLMGVGRGGSGAVDVPR